MIHRLFIKQLCIDSFTEHYWSMIINPLNYKPAWLFRYLNTFNSALPLYLNLKHRKITSNCGQYGQNHWKSMKIINSTRSCRMARQNSRSNLKTSKTTKQPKCNRDTGLKPEKVVKTGEKCEIRLKIAYWHGKKRSVSPKFTKITPSTQIYPRIRSKLEKLPKSFKKGPKGPFTKKL